MLIQLNFKAALLATAWLIPMIGLLVNADRVSGVTIAWSTVGDPGNAADPTTGFGAVDHVYNIGTYDVTTGQYAAFLNAVAANDIYGLWNSDMIFFNGALLNPPSGIAQGGAPGSFTYSVIGNPNMPTFAVTWGDAARFANWMNNGQPANLGEGAGSTETGAYSLNGAVADAALAVVPRNAGATIFLPSIDEWYKAAYYKGSGTNAGYWLYPTQSNTAPSNVFSATGTNNANFFDNGLTDPVNYLTPVGAFAGSPGPYGTYDMGGDVYQWNDAYQGGLYRDMRGGSWDSESYELASNYFAGGAPTFETDADGFRLASVPEPGSSALLLAGAAGLLVRRTSRGRRVVAR